MKFLILIIALLATPAFAEVAVIVNPAVSADIDAASVSGLFLGRTRSLPDGTPLAPVVQSSGSAVTDEFCRGALKKTSSQFSAYWSKLVFTGKGKPPKEAASDAEVMALVAANPGMIGYVDAAAVDGSVRVALKY